MTACLVQWLARLTAIQEVPGSIPGYTLQIFLEVQGLEWGSPSLARTIGWLLDMRNSETRLRKLKLRLRDKRFANHKAPCTAIWQQPLQSVLALRGCSAPDLFIYKSKFLKLEYWALTLTIPTGRGEASEAHKNNFSLLIFNHFE